VRHQRKADGTAFQGLAGLLVLPYLAGERTPVFDPGARGVFAGLTLRHGRGHLFRAADEGSSLGIRQILDRFDDAHTGLRVVAVGGGLRSPIWMQTLTDITGRVQQVPEQGIGASYGDALLAAIGIGMVPRDTDWAKIANEITPDPRLREMYDLYGTWCGLSPRPRSWCIDLGRPPSRRGLLSPSCSVAASDAGHSAVLATPLGSAKRPNGSGRSSVRTGPPSGSSTVTSSFSATPALLTGTSSPPKAANASICGYQSVTQ
jgi:hypothetical protein